MRGYILFLLLLGVALALVAGAQAIVTVGNGVYEVNVQDGASDHGTFNMGTGASFGSAAQNNKQITYNFSPGGGSTFSFTSVKSFTTNSVYSANFGTLDAYAVSTAASGATVTTTWAVASGTDILDIEQRITVGSTDGSDTSADSFIQIEIEVCNAHPSLPVSVGMKNFWDLMIAGDDSSQKAWVYPDLSEDPFDNIQEDVNNPTYLAFNNEDTPATFNVYGLIKDDTNAVLPEPPVGPDKFLYWNWGSSNVAWDGWTGSAGSSAGDSAATYFWGYNTPYVLDPGDCQEVRTYATLVLDAVIDIDDPVADFTFSPPTSCAPVSVTFTDDSLAIDPSATLVQSDWDWGDGNSDTYNPWQNTVSHVYAAGGTYTITLTVTDSNGNQDTTTQDIVIDDCPPPPPPQYTCASFDGLAPIEVDEGQFISFVVTWSDPDGNATTLTWSASPALPAAAEMDASTGFFSWQTEDGDSGNYLITFTLQEVDDTSCMDTMSVPLSIVPPEPPAEQPGDADNDGIPDLQDNCPQTPNESQIDGDGNGQGDACDPEGAAEETPTDDEGDDGSGQAIPDDGTGVTPGSISSDVDLDGIADHADNCPTTPNQGQEDLDADGEGDVCDADVDGDAILEAEGDNCPLVANTNQADLDGDGIGDACQDVPFTTELGEDAPDGDDTATGSQDQNEEASVAGAARSGSSGSFWVWLAPLLVGAVVAAVFILVAVRRRK